MSEHPHDHTHEHYGLSALAEHLRIWHEDGDVPAVDEPHGEQHVFEVSAHDSDSARIDVHPWAVPLFKDAEVVFASIEGVQKADAILSAIRRDGILASVYSVPSVTLWKDPSTPQFVDGYLRGKIVVVVPDADWSDASKKGAVENQARIYHGYLAGLGIERVHVAAAPQSFFAESGDKGIDDFLGAGGQLSDMVCIDVEPPSMRKVLAWVNGAVKETGVRVNVIKAAAMITSLSMFASSKGGHIRVSQGCMANILGVTQQAVSLRLDVLQQLGAIEYDGALAIGRNYFGSMDWINQPTIRIVPEALRASRLPDRTLIDVLGPTFFGR